MPLYEYQCSKCGKISEVMQKFSDAPLEKCPECEGKVEKILSRTTFQLKGSGWYLTDYKKSSSPAPSAPEAPAASTSSGSDKAPSCSSGPCSKD